MDRVGYPLYLVTDRHQTRGRPLEHVVTEACASGLPAVQLREKDLPVRPFLTLAQTLRRITREYRTRLLINGRVDVALAVEADGVHLPSDGLPPDQVRRLIGPKRLLGVSCHRVDEVVEAERSGADYVVFGPIYPTPSKAPYGPPLGTALLQQACSAVEIPILAIGGVKRENMAALREAGAAGVAIISAVWTQEDIRRAMKGLWEEMEPCRQSE